MKKSGFVTISGQPNVGKSTLLNGFLKKKVAITSKRPETTRDNIRGILTTENYQIVFIDTPGLHKPKNLLGKLMVKRAESSILESDITILMTEKKIALNHNDMDIISRLPDAEENKKVILVINKCDRVKHKESLLPIIEEAHKIYPFSDVIPMSALNPDDITRLLEVLESYLPEGPFYYPDDQISDKNDDFIIQEIIREKILVSTFEEVPHSVAIVIDELYEDKKGILNIYATIFVERPSQKAIIIGKSGSKLKQIGQSSRIELESVFSKKVYLNLWVKVFEKWKKDPQALNEIGYSD